MSEFIWVPSSRDVRAPFRLPVISATDGHRDFLDPLSARHYREAADFLQTDPSSVEFWIAWALPNCSYVRQYLDWLVQQPPPSVRLQDYALRVYAVDLEVWNACIKDRWSTSAESAIWHLYVHGCPTQPAECVVTVNLAEPQWLLDTWLARPYILHAWFPPIARPLGARTPVAPAHQASRRLWTYQRAIQSALPH